MFIVKWVEMDDIFNYRSAILLFHTFDEARNAKSKIEDKIEGQQELSDNLFVGKIISEPEIEQIEFE